MVVVCDPVNPFGTVQRREELEALLRLSAERGVVILADTTHSAHRVDPAARHHPIAAVAADHPDATVLVSSGLAHGYGMAGARIGALGGDPALVRRLPAGEDRGRAPQHQPRGPGRRGGRAARRGLAAPGRGRSSAATWPRCARSRRPVVEPAYGFSCVVDVSGTGASAQELTVALCRRRVAVYPGDGLGEVGATTTIRLNLSDPDPRRSARFAAAYLPTRSRRRRPAPTATPSATSSCRTAPTAAGASPPWWRAGCDGPSRRASPGRAAAGRRRGGPRRRVDAVTARPPSSKHRPPRRRQRDLDGVGVDARHELHEHGDARHRRAGGGVSSKRRQRRAPAPVSTPA